VALKHFKCETTSRFSHGREGWIIGDEQCQKIGGGYTKGSGGLSPLPPLRFLPSGALPGGLSSQQESGDTLVLAHRKVDVAQNRQGGCYHGAVRTRINFKSPPKLSNPLVHPPQTDAP
jgi:hypothetical protein